MKRALFFVSALLIAILLGCKVSAPGKLESSIVKEVKKTMTVGGKDWTNPVADSPEAVKEGQEHFMHHCGICHGYDAQNTGVPFADKMSPPVPELSSKDVQDYKDGQLKWVIENGIAPSGMPGWKGILEDDEMWKIVRYLRKLPAKGSLGIPAIYKEEAEEHQEMKDAAHPKAGESKPQENHHHH